MGSLTVTMTHLEMGLKILRWLIFVIEHQSNCMQYWAILLMLRNQGAKEIIHMSIAPDMVLIIAYSLSFSNPLFSNLS